MLLKRLSRKNWKKVTHVVLKNDDERQLAVKTAAFKRERSKDIQNSAEGMKLDKR